MYSVYQQADRGPPNTTYSNGASIRKVRHPSQSQMVQPATLAADGVVQMGVWLCGKRSWGWGEIRAGHHRGLCMGVVGDVTISGVCLCCHGIWAARLPQLLVCSFYDVLPV